MNKIDKLKIFLQENYPNEQAFNTRNTVGDSMAIVYNEDGIIVDYCYEYEYIEIFGLTDVEFENLIDDYGMLKNFNDEMMEENSIKNERSSIEEDIEKLESIIKINNDYLKGIENQTINQKEIKALEHILLDYKRVLKENEILKKEKEQAWEEWNNLEQGSYETEQKLKQQIKKLQKENEELKQDRNNNYQMIALAQNEALGYMQGYEDGKKLKRSAIANIVENQQYYIIKKQIEKYETYIEQLRKELGQKDKIIDLMAETINNHDIDEDICKQMGQKANCNEFEDTEKCKECIKQYFNNKAKKIK